MSFTITEPSPITATTTSLDNNKSINLNFANQLPTDTTTQITPTTVSPSEEGTSDAFGGTAGLSDDTNLSPLPTTPYLQNGNNPGIGTSIPIEYTTTNTGTYDVKNVLNNDTTFSYSDYNTMMLSKENNNLNKLNNLANNDLLKTANNKRFFNLSLKEIIDKTILTVVAIFIDLLKLMKPEESIKRENMSYMDKAGVYSSIFIKNDRMVYFGVFLIFMSLLFMVVFLSS
jgi:hypothetical protein